MKINIKINKTSIKFFFGKSFQFFIFFLIIGGFLAASGYLEQEYKPGLYAQSIVLNKNNQISKALFSPDDNIKRTLLDLIESEKKSIKIAIYTLTCKEIAMALIDAKNRGIKIEIVTDKYYQRPESYSKIDLLIQNNLSIYTFAPKAKTSYCLMHNKFAIFENNILDRSIIWTGSFNWTKSANNSNQENVVINDDAEIIADFNKQFEILKDRSELKKNGNAFENRDPIRPAVQNSSHNSSWIEDMWISLWDSSIRN